MRAETIPMLENGHVYRINYGEAGRNVIENVFMLWCYGEKADDEMLTLIFPSRRDGNGKVLMPGTIHTRTRKGFMFELTTHVTIIEDVTDQFLKAVHTTMDIDKQFKEKVMQWL